MDGGVEGLLDAIKVVSLERVGICCVAPSCWAGVWVLERGELLRACRGELCCARRFGEPVGSDEGDCMMGKHESGELAVQTVAIAGLERNNI
jgi:hypothetical protein